jgi:hypothetical protein
MWETLITLIRCVRYNINVDSLRSQPTTLQIQAATINCVRYNINIDSLPTNNSSSLSDKNKWRDFDYKSWLGDLIRGVDYGIWFFMVVTDAMNQGIPFLLCTWKIWQAVYWWAHSRFEHKHLHFSIKILSFDRKYRANVREIDNSNALYSR